MFCPTCGTQTNEQLKYCKQCGTNLRRVLGVLGRGGAGGGADWNKFAYEEAEEKRKEKRRKTPEEKRYEEIKAGVITTSIGLGAMIFLRVLLHAVANSEGGPDAEILRSVWVVGIVPFLIGLGILFNGVVISQKIVQLKRRQELPPQPAQSPSFDTSPVAQLTEPSAPALAPPAAGFSVAEPTTARLREPAPLSRDTN